MAVQRSLVAAVRSGQPLWVSVGLVVALASIPLFFVLYSALTLSAGGWTGLWTHRLPGLLWNTLALAFLVALGSIIIALPSAWLIARRRFTGRTLATWLMVVPLTIPSYVLAHAYTVVLREDSWLTAIWRQLSGSNTTLPNIYNLYGAAFVLTLASYPYLFLLLRMAFMGASRTLEDAARVHGARPKQVLTRVTLPLLRPALAAGLALVVLHVLAEFGAVSMLRYQTFTQAIYLEMRAGFDYSAAAALSLVLVCLSLSFLVLERFFRRRQRYYAAPQTRRAESRPVAAGGSVLIWLWLGAVIIPAGVIPVAWMGYWSWQAWLAHAIDPRFWGYVFNSLTIAFLAATAAVVCAFPVALLHARRHSAASGLMMHLSSIGFVLPGPVIALGIITFLLTWLPPLYGGLAALVMALVIRFLPIATQAEEAALQQLTPSIEQAGRILGAGPIENVWRVTLPLTRGGLVAAWVMVFLDVFKELPATLVLRPVGFDTLPVRIWIEASEEMLEQAAPAALMLVVGTLPALWIMMRTRNKWN